MRFMDTAALAALLAAAPLAAQSTSAPPSPTPTPTPSPAPAGDAVGPPQLRDFNLNGAVTQPAPATTPTPAPTTTPAPRAPAPDTATPAEPRATPAPVSAAPVSAPARRRPTVAAPDRNPQSDAVTVDLPPPSVVPVVPDASPTPLPAPEPPSEPPLAANDSPSSWWPWLAALLALGLGAAFLWARRQRSGRERLAADNAELGALVATPPAPPKPLPRAARPVPPPQSPIPDAARPLPQPPRAPAPPPPVAPPAPVSGGIVASGLKPKIEFELVPIQAETDNGEGAALTVDIILINRGSAPARDVLVEAQLINAGAQVDAEVGRYFTQPPGTGQRIAVIPPMASAAVKVRLEVPGDKLAPLVIEGRKLLVPMVAINAFYRWSGGELADSSSFLVGRGEADGGKMAPFRLDQGARSWSGLAARLHSSGLQR